jgi:uncharacterized membrane protein YfcA
VGGGELAVVIVAVLVAALVQVLAGFGFALMAMPIMTLAIPVERAVVIVSLLSVVTTLWQSIHLRHDAEPALVRRLTLGSLIGMPLGLLVLNTVADRPLRIALGVSVLIATFLLARRLNLTHAGPALDHAAGFVSGVLNTSLGTNGPPLVFVLQARHLTPDRFRATISTVFVFGNVVALALFAGSGKITGGAMSAAALAAPAWLAGQVTGWRLRHHVAGERFRVLVLMLLAAAGVTAILFAIM